MSESEVSSGNENDGKEIKEAEDASAQNEALSHQEIVMLSK